MRTFESSTPVARASLDVLAPRPTVSGLVFVEVLTCAPANVLVPVKLLVPSFSGTLLLNRPSANVPVAMLLAFRFVSREPFSAGRNPEPFNWTN